MTAGSRCQESTAEASFVYRRKTAERHERVVLGGDYHGRAVDFVEKFARAGLAVIFFGAAKSRIRRCKRHYQSHVRCARLAVLPGRSGAGKRLAFSYIRNFRLRTKFFSYIRLTPFSICLTQPSRSIGGQIAPGRRPGENQKAYPKFCPDAWHHIRQRPLKRHCPPSENPHR